jgi:hypothetical protein
LDAKDSQGTGLSNGMQHVGPLLVILMSKKLKKFEMLKKGPKMTIFR